MDLDPTCGCLNAAQIGFSVSSPGHSRSADEDSDILVQSREEAVRKQKNWQLRLPPRWRG